MLVVLTQFATLSLYKPDFIIEFSFIWQKVCKINHLLAFRCAPYAVQNFLFGFSELFKMFEMFYSPTKLDDKCLVLS